VTHDELIAESNRQFIGAWRLMAEPLPGARIHEDDGIAISDANAPLFILNAGFFTSPLRAAADARRRVAKILDVYSDSQHGWMLPVCEEWATGAAGEALKEELMGAGLNPVMSLTGMAADKLAAPAHPPCEGLDIRLVTTKEQSEAVGVLNCEANHIPGEMWRASVSGDGYWTAPRSAYLAYEEGEPVAAGAVFPVDGAAYIGWMATAESHRGKGLAEAIMRRALADEEQRTGARRTVLHATEMGEPVYRRLGYQAHTAFTCWMGMPVQTGATV
jgi:GNAT superfamily N-acetyltransferase